MIKKYLINFFVFIICFSIDLLVVHAQSVKEVLERTWYGGGRFSASILEGGYGYLQYKLYGVKVYDDNSFTGILEETFRLDSRDYRRTTNVKGNVYPSDNRIEFSDNGVRSSDYLPSNFSWCRNNFFLKIGRFNDRPDNIGMKGTNKCGESSIEAEFMDAP
ncbi:MAG: hypothetical protein N2050_08765 [Flavobacteriales bacterium]|nr:hypothetical protein [Flavobacteriales bacterium]MCX7650627.1 hypothetical protein [Flavobacteriales bacterium]MDW8432874.1 hypothetical protein [Flavobacteriales bacterium]